METLPLQRRDTAPDVSSASLYGLDAWERSREEVLIVKLGGTFFAKSCLSLGTGEADDEQIDNRRPAGFDLSPDDAA